jgi:hypothetical protein
VQAEQVAVAVGVEFDRLARAGQLGSELQRLEHGPAGQIGTGKAEREAEVVLDPGACRGLPAGADGVQQHGIQALGRPVDRGGQAGRARADDRDVNRRRPDDAGTADCDPAVRGERGRTWLPGDDDPSVSVVDRCAQDHLLEYHW